VKPPEEETPVGFCRRLVGREGKWNNLSGQRVKFTALFCVNIMKDFRGLSLFFLCEKVANKHIGFL